MRLSLWLLASLGLAPTLAAQNDFPDRPGGATFASRSGLPGTSDGEVLMRISHNANGVSVLGPFVPEYCGELQTSGPLGAIMSIASGWQVTLQDQVGVTPESFDMAIIPDSGAGQPDVTMDICRAGPLPLPPSGAMGPVSWTITVSSGPPPCAWPVGGDNIYYGPRLDPNPLWPADGLSMHFASDFAHPNAPQLCFTIDRTAGGTIAQPPTFRMHRVFLRGPGAVHINGAHNPLFLPGPNPSFGAVGDYPDQTTRSDGLAFRFRDVGHPATAVATLGSIGGFGTPPLLIPGAVRGFLCLNLPTMASFTFAAGVTGPGGRYDQVVLPFPLLGGGGRTTGIWAFQSFALDLSGVPIYLATNASMVHPL